MTVSENPVFESFKRICSGVNMRGQLSALNNQFAKAAALSVVPDAATFAEAMLLLDPECSGEPQRCVYCKVQPRSDWDHLVGVVLDLEPSGFGNYLGNLVPACSDCNGSKSNSPWLGWFEANFGPLHPHSPALDRARRIAYYQRFYAYSPLVLQRLEVLAPDTVARYEDAALKAHDALQVLAEVAEEIQQVAAWDSGLWTAPVPKQKVQRSLRALVRDAAESDTEWLARRHPRRARVYGDMAEWEQLANQYEEHVLHLYRTVPDPSDPAVRFLGDITEARCPLPAGISCPVHGGQR